MTTATAASPQVVIPPNIKVRDFFGEHKNDRDYSIVAFISDIEKAEELNGWSTRQTAAFASTCLKGAVATHVHCLQLDPKRKSETEEWEMLKKLMHDRFEEKISATMYLQYDKRPQN